MGYLQDEAARRAKAYPTAADARLLFWTAYAQLLAMGWQGEPIPPTKPYLPDNLLGPEWRHEMQVLSYLDDGYFRLSELGEPPPVRNEVLLATGKVVFFLRGAAQQLHRWQRSAIAPPHYVLMWRPG
jgi:hypothetical protein